MKPCLVPRPSCRASTPPARRAQRRRGRSLVPLAALCALVALAAWLGTRYLAGGSDPAPRLESEPIPGGAPAEPATPTGSSAARPDPTPERPLRLVGRALGPDGEPLARGVLRAGLEAAGEGERTERSLEARITADDQGRFAWELERGPGPGERAVLETRRRGLELATRLELSARGAGELDLGDVRFQPLPVLVEGRLVDSEGDPVAGAEIRVHPAPSGPSPRRPSGAIAGVRSDSTGAFEIRGARPGSELELRIVHPEHAELVTVLEAGRTGLVLTLAEGGSLSGRILFDDEVDPRRLWLALSGGGPQEPRPPAHLDGEGRFRFHPYHAGRGDLVLQGLGWVGEPLVLLEDLHLSAELEPDPRLTSFDLRGRLTATRLVAKDPEGAALERLTIHRAEGAATLSLAVDPGGGAEATAGATRAEHLVICVGGPLAVEVEAPGLRRVALVLSGGAQEILFQSGFALELTLEGLAQLPAGCSAGIRLRLADRYSGPVVAAAPEGVARLELPEAGTWVGHVILTHQAGSRSTTRRGQELRLEVADTPEVQRLAVALDATTLERAAELAGE